MWNRMAGVKSRVHERKVDCFALPILVGTATKYVDDARDQPVNFYDISKKPLDHDLVDVVVFS